MGTILPPFVLRARPIGVVEFMEAVVETCPPIFGSLFRTPAFRDVGIAVSGGVDSMALAVLCSKAKNSVHLRIGDHRPSEFQPFVVDHGLREGSGSEAENVINELSKLNVKIQQAHVKLRWSLLLEQFNVDHPSKLPGLEALARKLRYQALARACVNSNISSLLVAHHEDDQYETVLMRLLGGHGLRGLRGMQPAADIPESADIHRACRSGFHDDRSSSRQMYLMVPTPKQLGTLRNQLRNLDPSQYQAEPRQSCCTESESFQHLLNDANVGSTTRMSPPLEALDIEDGGITVYRPLLAFPKDRLVATCLVNHIKWFEDHTNHDPTFTTRNALRYVWKNHVLPKTLQKPSILALSARCSATVEAENAEADRLLQKTVIRQFQPNVGTVVVQFPKYGLNTFSSKDRRNPRRRQLRILKRRLVAALVIRKCISLVSPAHNSDLSTLQSFVDVLFPDFYPGGSGSRQKRNPPSAITIAGVYCVPVTHQLSANEEAYQLSGTRWFLSRAPFPANKKPSVQIGTTRYGIWSRSSGSYLPFHNFDGRFWISILHRLPTRIAVEPFSPEHSKGFRQALSVADRKKLDELLKLYAPGKTRFTLPALYLTRIRDGNLFRRELAMWGDLFEKVNAVNVDPVFNRSVDSSGSGPAENENMIYQVKRAADGNDRFMHGTAGGRTLIALPTLGIQVNGLEKLMKCRVRYKNVDLGILKNSGTWGSSEFWARWSGGGVGGNAWHNTVRREASVWRNRKKSGLREQRKIRVHGDGADYFDKKMCDGCY